MNDVGQFSKDRLEIFKSVSRLSNSGFTLIELVMVIVILGVLAAVAVPRFINFSGDAEVAAVKAVAGSIGSASAINYAACSIGNGCVNISNCNEAGMLLEGGVPDGYTLDAQAVAAGATANCVVTHASSGNTSSFILHGT
ncbi:MAG: type II secretion system GspH family protein [Nitrospinota bacterium]|nr:type II secretion system GspH family protein [Nitrospinota bacterium]